MFKAVEKAAAYVLLLGMMFGVFVVLTTPFEIVAKRRAESWPSRRGVITVSSPTLQRGAGTRGSSAPYYRADIGGTYVDTGEKFWIRRVRFGGFRWGAGKADAFATCAKYPVGSEIDVFYAPNDPRETVLEAKSPWTELIVLVSIGVGFLLVPIVLWTFRRRDAGARGATTLGPTTTSGAIS